MNLKHFLILVAMAVGIVAMVAFSIPIIADVIAKHSSRFEVVIPKTASKPPQPAKTRDGRWEQDLMYLKAELPRLHIRPFTKTTANDFNALIDATIKRVSQLSEDAMTVEIMRIVASIGDGHTNLQPLARFHTFPIWLWWFQNQLYVVYAGQGFEFLLGAKLERISKFSVPEAIEKIKPFIGADSTIDLETSAARIFIVPEILHFSGLQPLLKKGEFTFILSDKSVKKVVLQGLEPSKITWRESYQNQPQYLVDFNKTVWVKQLKQHKIGYVKYNSCRDFAAMADATKQLSEMLEQFEIDRVILDLRGNGGGHSEVIRPLLDMLLQQPLLFQPKRFFVFIDSDTYSSAMMNALDIRERFPHATFVGNTTGGSLNFFGDSDDLILPNSKLKVVYSTQHFELLTGHQGGLSPDVFVKPTFQDWKLGRDPVLNYVIQQIK